MNLILFVPDGFLTANQVEVQMQVPKKVLREWLALGYLIAVGKIGHRPVYSRLDVVRCIMYSDSHPDLLTRDVMTKHLREAGMSSNEAGKFLNELELKTRSRPLSNDLRVLVQDALVSPPPVTATIKPLAKLRRRGFGSI